MQIAIIGSGNVGGALASVWAEKGHSILLGVQDLASFKGQALLANPRTQACSIRDAIAASDVVLIATPPTAIFSILDAAEAPQERVWIDATNAVRGAPEPFPTVYHCIAALPNTHVVKCFNNTGFENLRNPRYGEEGLDMFMAGESDTAKALAHQLALDAGFATCIDFGKGDKVELLEKFALSWINLAILQGHGRNIAFKLLRR